jgi:hypothetical protein
VKRLTITIPGVNPKVSQIIVHYVGIFMAVFIPQLVAGVTTSYTIPTLLAVIRSAAAAGLIAVVQIACGQIPTAGAYATQHRGVADGNATIIWTTYSAVGIPLVVKKGGYQILLGMATTFVMIFGAELATGKIPGQSFPGLLAFVLAAISAAVAGVVQYVTGLIPTPKDLLPHKVD